MAARRGGAWGRTSASAAWGTVREDYSANGDAWDYLPARPRALAAPIAGTRTGSAGICDDRQTLCFALAFWNGRDPILKERIFGLSGPEGNHGEDAKEYWWYLDSTPTHSWMRWRYMYPQAAFPYERLRRREPPRAASSSPSSSSLDTGVFDDDRYWEITVDYAKAVAGGHPRADQRPQPRARGGDASTCCRRSGSATRGRGASTPPRPSIRLGETARWSRHHGASARAALRGRRRAARRSSATTRPTRERLFGAPSATPYPKDGINDHVVAARATVNPERVGTKAALPLPPRGRRRARRADDRAAAERRPTASRRRRLRRRHAHARRGRGRRVLRRR